MPEETASKRLKRRGILAAAGAVVAGIVAKQASVPVAATSGGGDQGFLALGSNPWYVASTLAANTPAISSAPTVIQASPNFNFFAGINGGHRVLLEVDASTAQGAGYNITGIHAVGYGAGDGVDGHSTTGNGVYGDSGYIGVYGTAAVGVYGKATDNADIGVGVSGLVLGQGTDTIGVSGQNVSTGARVIGVKGFCSNGTGVQGLVDGGDNGVANIIGVDGINQSEGSGGIGVRGWIPATGAVSTVAVYGLNQSKGTGGIGVYGSTSTGLYGIVGSSGTAQGSAGLLGVANGPNAVGFGTIAQNGATFAGYFNGTTVVNGAFAVTGSKSAAVKDANGDYRLMYSVESPEAWFEDFGSGTLVGGKAEIKIDPQFAQHVHADDYHVFLTEHSDDHLHVSQKSGGGFTVQADTALAKMKGKSTADLSGTFSYRIVAKRADIKGERLAKFTMPPPLVAPPQPAPAPLPGKKP